MAYFHDSMHHGPLGELFGMRDDEIMSIAHHLMRSAERLMEEAIDRLPSRPKVNIKREEKKTKAE